MVEKVDSVLHQEDFTLEEVIMDVITLIWMLPCMDGGMDCIWSWSTVFFTRGLHPKSGENNLTDLDMKSIHIIESMVWTN